LDGSVKKVVCTLAFHNAQKSTIDQESSEEKVFFFLIKKVLDRNKISDVSYLAEMKALSFFTGAMGLDLGIESAGFDVLLAAELDAAARATIEANRPGRPVIQDVGQVDAAGVRRLARLRAKETIDLVFGGPPCQSFSTAGKRLGFQDTRGNILLSFIDLIIALNPRYAVIENVRGLLSAPLLHRPHDQRGKGFPPLSPEENKGGALREVLHKLRDGGFSVSFNLYNSANFGTPQTRERVVMVCSRDGKKPPYLSPTHAEEPTLGLSRLAIFREAVGGLHEKDAQYDNFPEKRLRFYRMLKEGQNWRNLPQDIQREAMGASFAAAGGKTGFYRRLAWNKPSPTLVTHPAMPATDLAHPTMNRPLSIQEYLRVQEFPDDWRLAGNLIDKYRQVGNAVPVGFASSIGRLVAGLVAGTDSGASATPVQSSRYQATDDVAWSESVGGRTTNLVPA
jgi:DNA (cytosine-5)-methyltransferase 1